jgi:hypothetical protein
MPLAAILGVCLLLPWPQASIALPAAAVWQSAPSKENQPNNSPAQSSAAQQATEQQKGPDQSTTPSQPPPAAPSCPENSQSGSTAKPGCTPAKPAATKTKKHDRTQKTSKGAPSETGRPKTPSGASPQTKVVPNGSADDSSPNLTPAVSPEQASHQTDSTKRLLASSEANLKKISGRELSASQQETVKQINSYMDQAKTAESAGDVQRAYNLAVKANLLSAELAGP